MHPSNERSVLALALATAVCTALACGGSRSQGAAPPGAAASSAAASGSASTASGMFGVSRPTKPRPPVRLEVTTPEGRTIALQELRGAPVLLFLFATYDLASQMALKPLMGFGQRHPELKVIGIALQPNPAKLLELYAEFTAVTFPLTFDPADEILPGLSDLGRVTTVPTYVLVDETGHIVGRKTGPATEKELEDLLGNGPTP